MSRPPSPTVSDHAVLRELERRFGIDVEAVRRDIATRVRAAVAAGAVGVVADGLRYILRGSHVVTVIRGDRSAVAEAQQAEGVRHE
ncbi:MULTISPECIES: hypothetical protein [unclassified Xanthobacter]|uniref:hypothetical protein n=1 Tax=unclassified Xanthobacter TaxID=2623496 RepID=UPI001EDF94EA|nr:MULTISPECIES: hypothetical protein [unclassified Xanthobacter]